MAIVAQGGQPMKPKKNGHSQPGARRGLKELSPRKTSDVKGGRANAHEMKKALIGNIPR
jgi:hypothetical protein